MFALMHDDLACPFCNSRNVVPSSDHRGAFSECDDCGAQGPVAFGDVTDDLAARQLWNQRPAAPAEKEGRTAS
jgi:transcription elongation factor Elf1